MSNLLGNHSSVYTRCVVVKRRVVKLVYYVSENAFHDAFTAQDGAGEKEHYVQTGSS